MSIESSKLSLFQSNRYTGVVLFVLISGIGLTINLKERFHINWKSFYLKRFKAVLPLLWITYILQYFRLFYLHGTSPITGEKWRIIFSILGLDGYISKLTHTFYLGIGEWFIGMILVIYLLFPLLLYILNKSKKLFGCLILVFYILSQFLTDPTGYASIFLMLSIFCIGMLLGLSNKEISKLTFFILLIPFVFFQIFFVSFGGSPAGIGSLSDIIVSITGLLCLKYLCSFVHSTRIKKSFKSLSNLSYGMTLVNQQVMLFFTTKFSHRVISNLDMLSLYLLIFLTICLLSLVLNLIQKQLFDFLSIGKARLTTPEP